MTKIGGSFDSDSFFTDLRSFLHFEQCLSKGGEVRLAMILV